MDFWYSYEGRKGLRLCELITQREMGLGCEIPGQDFTRVKGGLTCVERGLGMIVLSDGNGG